LKEAWRKTFGFRLTKEHEELGKYLVSLSSYERAKFIRNALLWYYRAGHFEQKLSRIENKLDMVIRAIENGITVEKNEKRTQNNNDSEIEELEKMAMDGILEFVDLNDLKK